MGAYHRFSRHRLKPVLHRPALDEDLGADGGGAELGFVETGDDAGALGGRRGKHPTSNTQLPTRGNGR